eukprot:scaffold16636_cov237-Amphora_coffeaeformis.AAC.4
MVRDALLGTPIRTSDFTRRNEEASKFHHTTQQTSRIRTERFFFFFSQQAKQQPTTTLHAERNLLDRKTRLHHTLRSQQSIVMDSITFQQERHDQQSIPLESVFHSTGSLRSQLLRQERKDSSTTPSPPCTPVVTYYPCSSSPHVCPISPSLLSMPNDHRRSINNRSVTSIDSIPEDKGYEDDDDDEE